MHKALGLIPRAHIKCDKKYGQQVGRIEAVGGLWSELGWAERLLVKDGYKVRYIKLYIKSGI